MPDLLLTIVIPAYNEGLRIGKSLDQIRQYVASKTFSSEVIVVDDGSTDATPQLLAEIAAEWPLLRVVRNPCNRGKGASVRRGVLEARGKYVLFTDADLSAPIEQAGMLIAALESTGADAAVGSRALQRELIGVHQPRFREYAGMGFNLLVRLFTGLRLHDTQCGLKLFRRSTTRWAFECQRVEGFGFDPEILFLVKHRGGSVLEVPVRWNDDPATKVRFLRDSTRMFCELFRIRWRAWRGKYPTAASGQPDPSPPECRVAD
ncbi:MAG TPA: dolichyl-phosphate beta-glucosyltransferase [Terriglobia bacterium]|nr:dolichyl-phosphate beta-glucosyltransferase [Terriglobia bacterium]